MFKKLRAVLRLSWIYFLWITGAIWFAKQRARKRGAVIVLTLHRVLDDDEFAASSSLPGILIRQRTFDRFLAWAGQECEILDLGRGIPDWRPSTGRLRIALTFDDGWLDNHRLAQPVAARFGASMTVFICPGIVGRRFPFWPERVHRLIARPGGPEAVAKLLPDAGTRAGNIDIEDIIERLKRFEPGERDRLIDRLVTSLGDSAAHFEAEPTNQTMSWDEVCELAQRGVRFGSHTQNHAILTKVPMSSVQTELAQSRAEIEHRLNGPCELFAYPNGNCNPDVREAVARSGYRIAFTTEPGEWTSKTDPLLIPRMNLSENHMVGPGARFSAAVLEYSLFWRR